MMSIGIRRTMLRGLALMSLASFASLWMGASWQYVLTWGVLSGLGTGAVASVLGAGVVRQQSGSYVPAFMAAGIMGMVAAGVLLLSRRGAGRAMAATAA